MTELDEIFVKYETDKSVIGCFDRYAKNYCFHYDMFFKELKDKNNIVLEIGVKHGESLRAFKEYFKVSKIIGIDIDVNSLYANNPDAGIYVHIGNQTDEIFLSRLIKEHGSPNIIIDDGSHIPDEQLRTFEILFNHLADGGIYIIEDVHTSFHKNDFILIDSIKNSINDTLHKDKYHSIYFAKGLIIINKTE